MKPRRRPKRNKPLIKPPQARARKTPRRAKRNDVSLKYTTHHHLILYSHLTTLSSL